MLIADFTIILFVLLVTLLSLKNNNINVLAVLMFCEILWVISMLLIIINTLLLLEQGNIIYVFTALIFATIELIIGVLLVIRHYYDY